MPETIDKDAGSEGVVFRHDPVREIESGQAFVSGERFAEVSGKPGEGLRSRFVHEVSSGENVGFLGRTDLADKSWKSVAAEVVDLAVEVGEFLGEFRVDRFAEGDVDDFLVNLTAAFAWLFE